MKMIRCAECGEVECLSPHRWKVCVCGRSAGRYERDGDKVVVAGSAVLYGVSNGLFYGMRVEAWPYDESNGKVTRLAIVPAEAMEGVPA